jgi:crotonobetainyl-CoA:carnitine CoA-transferase CaiB-like acyl-CoA transferase
MNSALSKKMTHPVNLPSALNKTLTGIRVLSLALNLPGPAALMRLGAMGARCTKFEPASGDPMSSYQPQAYEAMHTGVKLVQADLKTQTGQKKLHALLKQTDVLITSFRPSALRKLGIDGKSLLKQYPSLIMLAILGAPGDRAEEPGHDLTYMADCDLVPGLELPASLFADMGGSLLTTEAILQALLLRQKPGRQQGKGLYLEVALSDAAAYLGLPRFWGLTAAKGSVGGAHAGYQIYPCKNGRVALAALEPHFAARLCAEAGIIEKPTHAFMMSKQARQPIANWCASKTRQQLEKIGVAKDIPLHTMP